MILTVQDVVDAFAETGLRPSRGWFFDWSDGKLVGACAMGAYGLSVGAAPEDIVGEKKSNTPFDDVPRSFLHGLIAGWDRAVNDLYLFEETGGEEFKAGYQVGKEAWELLGVEQ